VGAVVVLRFPPCALAALLLVLGACRSPAPALEERTYAPPGAALARVAVIPFYTHWAYQSSRMLGGVPPKTASERVTRLVVDAISERGIAMVPPAEVAAAIESVSRVTVAVDALIFADLAGRELGATGVLLGEVLRFREVRGTSPSGKRPASVAYQVTFYAAPEGFKLWTARFDETQAVPPSDLGLEPRAAEIHGRWLSAGEIAQRGADAVAKSLAEKL